MTTLYHGTPHALPVGTILLPGGLEGRSEWPGVDALRGVWMTSDLTHARMFMGEAGEMQRYNADGHIYLVEPVGQVSQLPDGRNPKNWYAEGARILGEVDPETGSPLAITTTAMNLGIRVQELRRVGDSTVAGVISDSQSAVIGWRGFGSWEEAKNAQRRGNWQSKGTFVVSDMEGRTQFASTARDVLRGSGYHQMRGSGFVGMVAVDLRGLPFRAMGNPWAVSRFTNDRHGQQGAWQVDKSNPTAGIFYPGLGLGIGIDTAILWNRVRYIVEITDGQISNGWTPEDFHNIGEIGEVIKDNPDWLPETTTDWTTTKLWTYRKGQGQVHINSLQTDKAWCGESRLGEKAWDRTPIRWLQDGYAVRPPEGKVKVKVCPRCLDKIYSKDRYERALVKEQQYEREQRDRYRSERARWGSSQVSYEVLEDMPPPAPMGSAEVRATIGGELVGKLLVTSDFYPSGSYRCWKVWNIGVEEAHRRKGIARGMVEALHRKHPKDKILHQGFMSEEGIAFAESLPPSWNRVRGLGDKGYRKPQRTAMATFDPSLTYYHGTPVKLPNGTVLTNEYEARNKGRHPDRVWATDRLTLAAAYGSHVYEVIPNGPAFAGAGGDPDRDPDDFPDPWPMWYSEGWTIVREVTQAEIERAKDERDARNIAEEAERAARRASLMTVADEITYTFEGGSWPTVRALHEDQVIGQLSLDPQGDHWDVVSIVVEPEYRGQGIATAMYAAKEAWKPGDTQGWINEVIVRDYPRGAGACKIVAEVVRDEMGLDIVDGVYWDGRTFEEAVENERVYTHWWNVYPNGDIFDGTAGQFHPSGDIIRTVKRSDPDWKHYLTWEEMGGISADVVERAGEIVEYAYPKFSAKGLLWHASPVPLPPGTVLVPSGPQGPQSRTGPVTPGREDDKNWVWMTREAKDAYGFALKLSIRGKEPYLYLVRPTSPVEERSYDWQPTPVTQSAVVVEQYPYETGSFDGDRSAHYSTPFEVDGKTVWGMDGRMALWKRAIERGTTFTAYADFEVDEGSIDSSSGRWSPDNLDFNFPRRSGDDGFYAREDAMLKAGMPRGQRFRTAEDIKRYAKPLIPAGLELIVAVTKRGGGQARGGISRRKDNGERVAVLMFTADMTWEWVVLHEVAHIRKQLSGASGASHGFNYAGEWAKLMYEQMGWRFDFGFPVAAALDPSRKGQCYVLSGQRVSEVRSGGGETLIHGSIQGDGHPRIGHAWVIQADGNVWEPYSNEVYDPFVFKLLFSAEEHEDYSQEEVWAITIATGHWGPWDEAEQANLKRLGSAGVEIEVRSEVARHEAIARAGGQVVGRLDIWGFPPRMFVDRVFVRPSHRRKGIATQMVRALEEVVGKGVIFPGDDVTDAGAAWSNSAIPDPDGREWVSTWGSEPNWTSWLDAAASKRTASRRMSENYRGHHQPPADGPPLHDLTQGFFPENVYDPGELRHYTHNSGGTVYDRESIRAVERTRGKPDSMVTIYRAAPEGSGINPGDWVSLSESYARMHGEGKVSEHWDEDREWTLDSGVSGKGEWVRYDPPRDWPVFTAKVPAHTIRNGGNDIIEWGYWGPPIRATKMAAMGLRYYHGTHHELPVGTVLRAGEAPANWGYSPGSTKGSLVWMTDDPKRAKRWAADGAWAFARGQGKSMDEAWAHQSTVYVYEVEPVGEVEPHAEGMWTDYAVPEARIVRRVEAAARTAALEVKYEERGRYGERSHITMEETGTIPIEVVRYMRGQMGEVPGQHRNKKGEVWEEFKRDLSENGMHYGIFIVVEVGEPVRIWEGNHRRDAAVELGWDEIPVQIRYFGHAEKDGTLMERWERGTLNKGIRSEAAGSTPRLFHGTPHALPIGTILVPGGPDGTLVNGGVNKAGWVWLTTDPKDALSWAESWPMNDDGTSTHHQGHAYEVDASEAMQIKDIPEPHKPYGAPGAWVAPSARIVAEVGPRGGRIKPTAGFNGTWMEPYYIRFGKVPSNEISYSNIDGMPEAGVSAYRMDTKGMPIEPDPEWFMEGGSGQDGYEAISGRILDCRRGQVDAFVVKGRIVGIGTDGEDLLKGVEVVGEWDPRDPLAWQHMPWEDPDDKPGTHFRRSKLAKADGTIDIYELYDGIKAQIWEGGFIRDVGQITWEEKQDRRVYSDDDAEAEAALGNHNGYYLEVESLVVHPDYRRKGIASMMMDRFIQMAEKQYGPKGWDPGSFTSDGAKFWKQYRGEDRRVTQTISDAQIRRVLSKLAARTIRLYHGTNAAALSQIRRMGQFVASTPEAVARQIEDRYGLPRDSVWRHKRNSFSWGRATDKHVYFSEEERTAAEYAKLGSEVVSDALMSAFHAIHFPNGEDADLEVNAPELAGRAQWISDETAKHYEPVVIALDVPWDAFAKAHAEQWSRAKARDGHEVGTWEWWHSIMGDTKATTVMLPAPVPASWIVSERKVSKLASAPTVGWHETAAQNRASIMEHGLQSGAEHGGEDLVWLYTDRGLNGTSVTPGFDLWRVDLTGIETYPGWEVSAEWLEDEPVVACGAVPPGKLTLEVEGTPHTAAANGGDVPASTPIRRAKVKNIDTDRLSRRREFLRVLIKDQSATLENRIDFVWKAAELHAIESELERRGELPDERITLASLVRTVLTPTSKVASTAGPIYRGVKVTLPAPLMAEVRALLNPPLDESQIDQERRIGALVVSWLQANHWDDEMGLGRHWTVRKDFARAAAMQGGSGNLGIILTATYDPADADPDHHGAHPITMESEGEVTLFPGSPVTITNVELPWAAEKWMKLIDTPIRATAGSAVYYHGSKADLPVGTVLVPGGPDRHANDQYHGSQDVWLTTRLTSAMAYAADGGFVYEVEPEGPTGMGPHLPDTFYARSATIVARIDLSTGLRTTAQSVGDERSGPLPRRNMAALAAGPKIEINSEPSRDPFMGDGPFRLSDDCLLYSAKVEGQNWPVGWMRLRRRHLTDDVWEIWRIHVEDDYQRQGIATAMIEQARKDLGRVDHAPMKDRTDDGKAWSHHVGSRKEIWEMTPGEFASKRWVYHGTRRQDDLEKLLREGVKISNVPMNLNRRRMQQADPNARPGDVDGVFFQPGAGAGMGLYVGDFWNAQQYGNRVVAIEVRDGDLSLGPESADYTDYWSLEDSIARALKDANGALITRDIPASRVYLVADGFTHYMKDPQEMARQYATKSAAIDQTVLQEAP